MDSRLVSPFLMWAIVIAGAAAIFFLLPGQIFGKSPFGLPIFALALINWAYFFSSALWNNRGAARSAAEVKGIVRTGVYSRVRHPIYFADIALAWGIFAFTPTFKVLLAASWLSVVLFRWAKIEEKALLEKFGKEYREYQKSVPMLIPKL